VELNKLRSQLRSVDLEKNDLAKEIRTLLSQIATKDAAIEALESRSTAAEERALQSEGELASSRREAMKYKSEQKRLQTELDAANADADRLNQLVLAGGSDENGGNSIEDVVRLHNQLAAQRKEITRLKEECKGANNVIQAKDKALIQVEVEIAAAKEAIASRKDDQNKIRDLRRQLTEAHAKLGGSERLGLMVETEASEAKAELTTRTAQFEKQQEMMAKMQGEVTAAQTAVMEAERIAAEARADAAAAVGLAEKARLAEAARMKEGGYISHLQHAEQVRLRENEIESFKERLQAAQSELQHAKMMRDRVLNAVDSTVDRIVSAEDISEELKTASGLVHELRNQIKDLRASLVAKDADNAALESLKNAAVARALHEKVEAHTAKARLAQEIGEYNYTLEFNEPAPGPRDQAEAAAAAATAQEAATATGVAAIAAERDAANVAAAEAKLLAIEAQKVAEKAAQGEAQALAAEEEARAARHVAEAAATAAALSVTEMQATLASKEQEVEGIHKALTALKEVDQRRQLDTEAGASLLKENSAEVARLTALVAAAELTKENMLTELENAKKDVVTLEEKVKEVTSASNEASTAALTELEAARAQLESSSVQYSKMKENLKLAEAAAAAAALAVSTKEQAEQDAALKISQLEEALIAAKGGASDAASAAEEAQQALKDLEIQLRDKDVLVADLESKLEKMEIAATKQATQLAEKTAEVNSASSALEALQTALEGAREKADADNLVSVGAIAGANRAATDDADALSAAATGMKPDADHLHELAASKVEVAVLKQKVDELESELEAISPLRDGQITPSGAAKIVGVGIGGDDGASSDLEESDEDDDEDDEGLPHGLRLSRGDAGTSLENAGMTSAALASVLDKLILARQAGTNTTENNNSREAAVYEEATKLLQAELARLGTELADDSDAASKLKSEVGALQTAHLSAEATAQLLENQNALYMRVSALQIALSEKEREYNKFEDAFLREIASLKAKLKAKKKKNPLSKAVSSAARGLNKGFEAAKTNVQDMVMNTTSSTPAGNAPTSAKKTGASPFASLSKRFMSAA
jgi:chromosome segregation ATPase